VRKSGKGRGLGRSAALSNAAEALARSGKDNGKDQAAATSAHRGRTPAVTVVEAESNASKSKGKGRGQGNDQSRADATGANFRQANLSQVCFVDTNLKGAKISLERRRRARLRAGPAGLWLWRKGRAARVVETGGPARAAVGL